MHQQAVKVQRGLPKNSSIAYLTILVYVSVMSWNNPLRTKYATMLDVYVFPGGSRTEAGGREVKITSRAIYVEAIPDLPRSQRESRWFA